MHLEVTKKVRLSRDGARTLSRLARRRRESESEVLREALALLARRQAREDGIEGLIGMAEGETYSKQPVELR